MVDIGGLINRLAPLIEKKVTQEYNLFINSKNEAHKLSDNLKEIQKMLEEAEKRRVTDPRVKNWLGRLQSVMYDIDDALDEWETEKFQIRNPEFCDCDGDDDGEADLFCTWLTKVSMFIQSLCSGFKHVRNVALKIKGLNEKVESLANETPKYSILLPIINSDSPAIKTKMTTSFSQLVEIESQHYNKDEIVKIITSHDLEGSIKIISLVGMAGIGKTTLAQLSFHDHIVQKEFELRLWICLSHTSDEVSVTKAILQSLIVSRYPKDVDLQNLLKRLHPKDADLQNLLKLLHILVSGKKLLLVLDNVWIEDDSFWRQLKGSLIYGGALESKILVTSRNENVAKSLGSTRIIRVECLSDSDCWLLFKEIAFCGMQKDERENLQGIGQRIAKKCEGLPLAAKTLGYYLRSRYIKKFWEDVLEKELWQLEEVAEALFAPFAFSYNELPLALKHCFSYFGILPRDTHARVTDVDELIRLWMMQGYLISADGTEDDMELKGMYYFEKLATRSFFQIVEKDPWERYYKYCTMHSIVQDFAQYLIKTAGSKVEKRRNAFIKDDQPFGNQLGTLKSVRVLSVDKQELPLDIGNLIHLRYLQLKSQHTIKKLPVSMCNLYNLHTLDLRFCRQLSELPERIHRLRNLRNLLLFGTDGLEQVPKGVGKLTHLRTLDEYKVGRSFSSNTDGSKLSYLADLKQLRGSMTIYIRKLNEEADVEDAEKAQLSNKNYVTDLTLRFHHEDVREDVMNALQPPPNLLYLWLTDYRRKKFPSWVNGTYLKKLIRLLIYRSRNCLELPPLGTLPFLEELQIVSLGSLKRVGPEFLRNEGNDLSPLFPKLSKLQFSGCKIWEKWEDITVDEASYTLSIMPCLKALSIKSCPRLKTLPHFLRGSIHVDTNHEDLQLLWEKRKRKIKNEDVARPSASSSINVN